MTHKITTDLKTVGTVYHKCFRDKYEYGLYTRETESLLNICQTVIANGAADSRPQSEKFVELELSDWEWEEWQRKVAKPVWK